jgi:hypothetical protein
VGGMMILPGRRADGLAERRPAPAQHAEVMGR